MKPRTPTVRRFAVVGAIGLMALIVGVFRSVLIAALAEVGEADPPQLVLSQANLDFAEVAPGQHLKGHVGLRNVGGQRLFVHKASGDCACCEDPSNAPVIIGPNTVARLPVELGAPTHPGAMTRSLSFETNDPKRPRFSVTVRASVN